jgi:predicted permease
MTAHGLLTDIRHVIRRLVASPSFSLIAVLSLGLAVGANTAVVSVARAALFATLPIERPEELSFIFWGPRIDGLGGMYSDGRLDPATGKQMSSNISFPAYQQLKQLERSGVSLGAFTFIPRTNVVIAGRPAEGATGILADGTFFHVVRPPMAIGRGLTPSDDRPDAPLAAVISYDFWQRVFAGAVTALDRPVTINGVPAQIVGVTARGFHGMSPGGFRPVTDITLPLALQPLLVPGWTPRQGSLFTDPHTLWVRAIVRLPGGGAAAFEQMASASLRAQLVAAGITDASGAAPTYARLQAAGRGVNLETAGIRTSVGILGMVSAAMLVVACLNLAGLLLARGLARQRELSVRAALGASRWQLLRLALLESTVLAGAGGALGIGLTFATRDLLGRMLSDGIGPVVGEVAIDGRILAITVGFSVVAALAAGLVPAFRLSSRRTHASLSARPGGTTAPRQRLGRALLAVQIAISLPLLTGAGLLLRTLHNLTRVELGFRPESLVTFRVDVPIQPDGTVAIPVYDRILAAVREVPGVRAASMVENPLISGVQSSRMVVADGFKQSISTNAGGPDVFEVLGARLVEGRGLETRDASGSESVVLNEAAARRLFKGPALGRELTIAASGDRPPRVAHVVGIVADMHYTSVRSTPPATLFDHYARHARESLTGLTFVVRTDQPAPLLERPLRAAVAQASPATGVTAFRSQTAQIAQTLGRERVFARLLTLVGAFGLLLAAIGLHGISAYSVAQRTSEIGVRLALGATTGRVLWMVLRQVAGIALAGIAVGVPAALAAGPLLRALLFGLAPTDAPTLGIAAVTLLSISLLAGWIPARRAAALDPLTAIRHD